MIEIIWAYRVRKERVAEFLDYYSSNGVWAELFQKATEYRGTDMLRDCEDPFRFATVDRWDSWEAFEQFKCDHQKEYDWIDTACAEFTTEETKVGVFES